MGRRTGQGQRPCSAGRRQRLRDAALRPGACRGAQPGAHVRHAGRQRHQPRTGTSPRYSVCQEPWLRHPCHCWHICTADILADVPQVAAPSDRHTLLVHSPGFMSAAPLPGVYNERVFRGLDYAIAQAAHHGIKIIIALNNYWENSDSVGNASNSCTVVLSGHIWCTALLCLCLYLSLVCLAGASPLPWTAMLQQYTCDRFPQATDRSHAVRQVGGAAEQGSVLEQHQGDRFDQGSHPQGEACHWQQTFRMALVAVQQLQRVQISGRLLLMNCPCC